MIPIITRGESIIRGVSLGFYVVIYQENIARAGPGFLFPPDARDYLYKIKTWDMPLVGEIGENVIGVPGACTCQKGQPWAYRLRAKSPVGNIF